MVFNGFLLISFYFFVFILPGIGIIFGIIELKNKISNKNAVSKKKNNRFGIYGIVSIFFIIFLLFFPIHTVLSLKYSKFLYTLFSLLYSPTSPVIYMVILAVQRSFSSLSRTVTSCTMVVLPLCRALHSIYSVPTPAGRT